MPSETFHFLLAGRNGCIMFDLEVSEAWKFILRKMTGQIRQDKGFGVDEKSAREMQIFSI